MMLNTELVKIEINGNQLILLVKASEGGWVEMMPFENDLRGRIAALSVAVDCLAGKFYPRRAVAESDRILRLK